MAVNSKQKGARFERLLASKFREYGYSDSKRTAQYCGKTGDAADVDGLPFIHVEAKHQEQMRLYEWMDQAKRDAAAGNDGRLPAVFHKKNNHDILVTMTLDDWMTVFREFESSMSLNEGKEVEKTILHFDGDYFKCPACENLVQENQTYCDECGQKLLWKNQKNRSDENGKIKRIEDND